MTVRNLVIYPDPRLNQKSVEVTAFDNDLKRLVKDMHESMQAHGGIGLAAVQIGVMQRIFVINIPEERIQNEHPDEAIQPEHPPSPPVMMTVINPEITAYSEESSKYQEGCLSIPEVYEDVTRPSEITLSYQDETGVRHQCQATGLLATAIQHEIDHLNGVLFIEHLSKLKRDRLLKKYTKLQQDKKSNA